METDLSITYIDTYDIGVYVRGFMGVAMTLGELLKRRRNAEGWTQEYIAGRAGRYQQKDVDQSHVSYWERNGIKRPTGEQLRMLAYAYELPVLELVIAADYLRRTDLADVAFESTEPPNDPVVLANQIAALTTRLTEMATKIRSPERQSRTAEEG
jgi:transcriptional regulator with XRE-family HTH domain